MNLWNARRTIYAVKEFCKTRELPGVESFEKMDFFYFQKIIVLELPKYFKIYEIRFLVYFRPPTVQETK